MNMRNFMWAGIILIFIIGVIHLMEMPEYFAEAAYMGLLFALNGIGSFVAAYGIFKGRAWGWILGILIAAGSIVGYLISRTVGLPQFPIQEWADVTAIISIVVEVLFILIAMKMLPMRDRA